MKMVDGKAVYLESKPESKSSIAGAYAVMFLIVAAIVGIWVFGHSSKKDYSQPAEVTQSK